MKKYLIFGLLMAVFFTSCSVQKQINKAADKFLINDSALATAHVGIALYNTANKKIVYNHNGEKYFVPASNTKILTCYAAMKYLGDSLVGLKYDTSRVEEGMLYIEGTGDPTFLHPDFIRQPVYDWLIKNVDKKFHLQDANWQEKALGKGWNWDDYQEDYMAERSTFPVYGNVARFRLINNKIEASPPAFYNSSFQWKNETLEDTSFYPNFYFKIVRPFENNDFHSLTQSSYGNKPFSQQTVPFKADYKTVTNLLSDTLHKEFAFADAIDFTSVIDFRLILHPHIIHSQPTDSLLKIMMHRSDNFFAEQTLLMVSNELLNFMSDEKIIDTLLKTDFKDLPQTPNWVDGSGLSRYNLISPQDFVTVLNKMKNNFSWNRISTIFATGGEGTLRIRYKNYVGKIYAKTGSLSDVISLSGFITTNKKHNYIFSVMVNNHQTDETEVRDKIEKFISTLIDKF